MYAVYNEKGVYYVGKDKELAMKVLEQNPTCDLTGKANMDWLVEKFNPSVSAQAVRSEEHTSELQSH